MKFTTIEAVTREEYVKHLRKKVESNHKTSKSGGKRGGTLATAIAYDEPPQIISNVLGGYTKPTRKMLAQDGLEERKVYVKKEAGDA